MTRTNIAARFSDLSTPLMSDAAMRAGVPLRLAPAGLRPVNPPLTRTCGRVLGACHRGSVDVFLEAISRAKGGEILVIDNAQRLDEGCIGDLITLEAWFAGLAGVVVWGCHRDSDEIRNIPIPLFSYGAHCAGPIRLDPEESVCRFGNAEITEDDYVFVDEDGAMLIESAHVPDVLAIAEEIAVSERAQASLIRAGRSLREQLQFDRSSRETKSLKP